MKKIGPYIILESGASREEVKEFVKFNLEEMAERSGQEWPVGYSEWKAQRWTDSILEDLGSQNIDHIAELFQATSKKDAEALAKGMTITESEFASLRMRCEELGYKHSDVYTDHVPADIDKNDLPVTIERTKDGKIETIGDTSLTEAQLAKVIAERKRMHIHIFEKGQEYHCLYATFRDIDGKHGRLGGHLHYVSHLWGIKKNALIRNLKQKKHQSIGTHIKFDSED